MPEQPVSQPKSIETLMETLGERVELHPIYQRDISWSQQNMCDLIQTVMATGFIPGILLYKLQGGDERSSPSHRYECVDGQHRFFTFFHYFHSKPVELVGKKPFLISLEYKEAGQTTHVFYKKTPATEIWTSENREKRVDYMTAAEQDHFNSFLLDIREIRSPLSLNQRRELFISLQKGKSVRNSDLYKNNTEVRLVRFISEEKRWESRVKGVFHEHLSVGPKNFWLHWMIRAYLISCAADEEERVAAFMHKDSQISQMIKNNSPLLASTAETEELFEAAVERFFAFLATLTPGVKLPPTHFFAIFTHLLDAEEGREKILVGHMDGFSKDGLTAKQRKLWENRGVEDEVRRDFFERVLDEIGSIRVPAPEITARKSIPKRIRDRVWTAFHGAEECGSCFCCGDSITVETWECGHILASKCGGKDEESNLRPTCRSCNRSMGTENMDAFKERCYPAAL
jgi:hypothetical protein